LKKLPSHLLEHGCLPQLAVAQDQDEAVTAREGVQGQHGELDVLVVPQHEEDPVGHLAGPHG
ncbi:hypothetical protein, partial [Citrobacter youngae]|uniref:hypothetical protein n=1 Tax=Citrobacter youngae TaxID=133448 RepID=UPI001EF851E1